MTKEGDMDINNLLSATPEPTEENAVTAEPDLNDELLNAILDHNPVEAKDEPVEAEDAPPEGKFQDQENGDKEEPEQSSMLMKLVDETDTSDKADNDKSKLKGKASKSNKSPKKKGGKPSRQAKEGYEQEEVDDDDYAKPPMSPELLIAIAVRNLDPHKDVGASCTDIVAFLSLHFPYFNDHYDECKVGPRST